MRSAQLTAAVVVIWFSNFDCDHKGGSGYCKFGWSKYDCPSGRSATFLIATYKKALVANYLIYLGNNVVLDDYAEAETLKLLVPLYDEMTSRDGEDLLGVDWGLD
ncbi:Actin-like protein arp8 [Sarracenia purpurea var. burkii]